MNTPIVTGQWVISKSAKFLGIHRVEFIEGSLEGSFATLAGVRPRHDVSDLEVVEVTFPMTLEEGLQWMADECGSLEMLNGRWRVYDAATALMGEGLTPLAAIRAAKATFRP